MKKLTHLYLAIAIVAVGTSAAYGNLLTESFEGDAFPPAGWVWEGINVQPYTWHQADNAGEGASFPTPDGDGFAIAYMAYNHLGLDEWLVSPVLNTSAADVAVGGLTLGSAQSYGWGGYDLELWVINGDGINDGDDQRVGSLGELWVSGPFAWVTFELSLDGLYTPGQDFRIGFRHVEFGQASTSALDAVYVTPEPGSLALLGVCGLLAFARRRR